MSVEELVKMIADTLKKLQTMSGRPCGALTGDTTPIGDLVGFDSLSGIELTVMIEALVGTTFKTDNVLVAHVGGRKRALTVTQAAQQVLKLLGGKVA